MNWLITMLRRGKRLWGDKPSILMIMWSLRWVEATGLMILDLGDPEKIRCFVLNKLIIDFVRVQLHHNADELSSILSADINEVIQLNIAYSSTHTVEQNHGAKHHKFRDIVATAILLKHSIN